MMQVYSRTLNKKKIIILNGDLNSLRCRQRNRDKDGLKVVSMNFVSYKEMEKEKLKNKKVYGPYDFFSISKL